VARWPILAGIALIVGACATTAPLRDSPVDRWWSDLSRYEKELGRFNSDVQQLVADFRALRAGPSFPAVEEKVKALAARSPSLDEGSPQGRIVRSLYTMSLGELLAFQSFLALSTRLATVEAAQAELEGLRLDLRFRRMALERESLPIETPPLLVEQPVTIPLACARYVVGSLVFASCE